MDDVCEGCGERNPAGSQFCLFCGAYLGWEEAVRQEAPDPTPASAKDTGSARVGDPAWVSNAADVAETPRARVPTDPTVVLPQESRATEGPAARPVCPQCARENDPTRRLCASCGCPLQSAGPVRATAAPRRRWWERWWDPGERRARRAYRHSLPAVYRWRRVAICLVTALGLGVLLAAVGTNPIAWSRDRWYDVTDQVVQVTGVEAVAVPAGSATRGHPAAAAVDGTPRDWATTWVPPKTTTSCGGAPGTGRLLVTLPPTRIRQIRVVTGTADPSRRALQYLPASLHVTLSDQTCLALPLDRGAGEQVLDVDSKVEVTSVQIAVGAATRPSDPRAQPVVAISEISLWSRPR